MAGAVAFVFGMCALSFAAGCVVTAIMLRATDPAEEAPQPIAPPAPEPVTAEQPRLRWPSEDFATKPIHRNPVVGRPAPAALELVPANAALTLIPDPPFTSVFDPPPLALAPLPARANEPRVEQAEQVDEPADETPRADLTALPVPADSPAADPEPVAEQASREPEQVSPVESITDPEPVAELVTASPLLLEAATRNGRRREIKLELVPQPESLPEGEPNPIAESEQESAEPELSQPDPSDAELPQPEAEQTGVPEQETTFVSRSGLITEPAEADAEAVVPEQGMGPEPESVVPKQQVPAANEEFRQRYLRTFEAARRRTNH